MNIKKNTFSDTTEWDSRVQVEEYPKLCAENGEIYFREERTGEIKKMKEYVVRKDRCMENPITIGREHPETIGKKDIILPAKYDYASRDHCEIFFDRDSNAYFLVDCSLNGTFINGELVGGNRIRRTRKLEHNDLIEIPTSKVEKGKVQLRFIMYKRPGLTDWFKGDWIKKPAEKSISKPMMTGDERKFFIF